MGFPILTVNRIVVFLHGGMLKEGNIAPLAVTDCGYPDLDAHIKMHLDAGAVVLYDGPPNQEPKHG